MLRIKILIFSFVALSSYFFVSPSYAADPLACCIKKSKIDAEHPTQIITYEQTTKKKCTEEIVKDYAETVWRENEDAGGSKCIAKVKPVTTRNNADPLEFTPSVTLPGKDSPYVAGQSVKLPESSRALADYIIAIFKYAIGIVGIIAAIVIMLGGVRWLMSAGGDAVSEAKTMIAGGLSGLVLTLGSFLLLSTINTSLVNLTVIPVANIARLDLAESGCCIKKSKTTPENALVTTTYETTTGDMCTEAATGQNVEFLIGQEAKGDHCEVVLGCCIIENTTDSMFSQLKNGWNNLWGGNPFDDPSVFKTVCVNNKKEAQCEKEKTSLAVNFLKKGGKAYILANLGPLGEIITSNNSTLNESLRTTFKNGLKCQVIDECKGNSVD